MAASQTPKERITKNETNITHIKQKLEKIELQLTEIQNDHRKFEINNLPLIQQNLQNIQTHLEQHQTKEQNAKLSGHDKTALYGSLITLLSLTAVEVLRILL